MSDLIERLDRARQAAERIGLNPRLADDIAEAADEIERLTALLDAEMESNKQLCDRELALATQLKQANGENTAMRAVLQIIKPEALAALETDDE